MFWIEALSIFALWIAYGVFQARRSDEIRAKMLAIPRGRRIFLSLTFLLVSLVILIGLLAILQSAGGFGQNGFALWAWFAVGIIGLGFVHAQTMVTAMLVTLAQEAVAQERAEASKQEKLL